MSGIKKMGPRNGPWEWVRTHFLNYGRLSPSWYTDRTLPAHCIRSCAASQNNDVRTCSPFQCILRTICEPASNVDLRVRKC